MEIQLVLCSFLVHLMLFYLLLMPSLWGIQLQKSWSVLLKSFNNWQERKCIGKISLILENSMGF